jgi:excisionase family DNA binding protein
MQITPKYLTIKNASIFFNISVSTLKRLIRNNRIKSYKYQRTILIKIVDIEKLFGIIQPEKTEKKRPDQFKSIDNTIENIIKELELPEKGTPINES